MLSKLTRGLVQADETILLHLKHVHRRLVRIIYSAIPNKSVAVRTLYTPALRLSQAARDELEAIHVLTVGSNLYSKASFELRARPDRVGDYAIVDGKRLISCLGEFANVLSLDDIGLISISTEINQVAQLTNLFESAWRSAEEVTEKTLIDLYAQRAPTEELITKVPPNVPVVAVPTVDELYAFTRSASGTDAG
jgi:hypothetical protein